MVAERPKIVIIGAGMAGITAAHKLYTASGGKDAFDLCIVEGGQRIGGRINTREFGGDRIEMGATWIHGICGSPVYEIAQKIKSLESEKPWECMGDLFEEKRSVTETRAEGGFVVNPDIVDPISSLFDRLMSVAQCKAEKGDLGGIQVSSIGEFLKLRLQQYWDSKSDKTEDMEEVKVCGNWSRKMLEEAIFAVYENTQRTYTGAGDLFNLDYAAESEYQMFSGDEITIPRGYITIVEFLASVLPPGMIQLGRKVVKIEWLGSENDDLSGNISNKPVKLRFSDGSVMQADHVIVTVSLGVLKAGVSEESGAGLFSPPLPFVKKEAILRLGYGVVNKLFLQLSPSESQEDGNLCKMPFLKMVFHRPDSEFRHKKIPWWMRKTSSMYPIYNNSSVLLSWFAGKEALELESLDDEAIIDDVSTTISSFISNPNQFHEECNGNMDFKDSEFEFREVLKSKWGTDPLFLGSYSYVAVGSSGDDFDTLAQPLPRAEDRGSTTGSPPLQVLFAGEATHRTHYSTTHGAYFSGVREASRLLQHYQLVKHITDIQ
ncbi:probable polyamine oxidase 5 [Chenopodium quinoa]|uniref:Amine oxidase domain-containing protein n=1 Tax=Chenopodium quinoa TaxID=63459 RepID=A0A803MDG5_CHEQI|nr:probable polyamine oxidase 5 [Chenopodium quinoa]